MAGFIFLLMLVTAMMAIGFIVGAFHRLSKWNRAYDRLGKRYAGGKSGKGGVIYGFPIFSRPSLSFDYGRTFCSIRNRKSLRFVVGRQTEVSMIWPNRKLKLEITTSAGKSRGWRPGAMKPVEVDDAEFLSTFSVSSNQPDVAQRLLTRNVLWQIEKLRRHGAYPELHIGLNRGSLVVAKPDFVKEYQPLEDYLRLALELFDQMMLVNAEGLEFVNDDKATVVEDVKCPICSEVITQDLVVCTRCKTPHCRDCWQYNGQCATFACSETRFLQIGSTPTGQAG